MLHQRRRAITTQADSDSGRKAPEIETALQEAYFLPPDNKRGLLGWTGQLQTPLVAPKSGSIFSPNYREEKTPREKPQNGTQETQQVPAEADLLGPQ